jgi:hypothetical protein
MSCRSSYRDLLGTADSIVRMDEQMQEVEINLSETSHRCNTTRLKKSFSNSTQLKSHSEAQKHERFVTASQLAVFRRCPEVLVRTLRRGGSILLAAKVLVISRLLHKQLAGNEVTTDQVGNTWARLGRLRQKLLARVDHRLASLTLEPSQLVAALCAYALATSTSSPTDLLRYFHHIRVDAISAKLRNGTNDHQSVLEALKLWIKTLQDTRALFPKQLTQALSNLRSVPLLKDNDVRAIVEFDFDVHGRWLGDDVQHFVPYIRREDMSISDASKQLSSWAPMALHKLLSNLKGCLSAVYSLTEIIELRKACLELLFSHYHIAGVRRNGVLKGFRDSFEERLLEIVKQHCDSLINVSADITEILDDWDTYKAQQTCQTLWDSSMTSMGIQHGAGEFTTRLRSTVHGRTSSVRMVQEHYGSWLARIGEIENTIEIMRNTRWEDHLDDLSEDSGSDSEMEEEEATLSRVKISLKETDPATVRRSLATHLSGAFQAFKDTIEKLAGALGDDTTEASSKSVFLIRVLREVKHHLPQAYELGTLKIGVVSNLHRYIAKPVVNTIVERHEHAIVKSLQRSIPAGRALWDGTPELPVLPSPWVFRLLKDLEQELAVVGTDIWSSAARDEMKILLNERLEQSLLAAEDKLAANTHTETNAKINGTSPDADASKDENEDGEEKNSTSGRTKESSPSETTTHDSMIQQLFDVVFIHASAMVANNEAGHRLPEGYMKSLQEKVNLDHEQIERLKASARAYRKRTSLLFTFTS